MKTELINYASDQIMRLKEIEKDCQILIDIDKVRLLFEEWIEKNNECSKKDVDTFFRNVYQIVEAEIEIRELSQEQKSIWLTK